MNLEKKPFWLKGALAGLFIDLLVVIIIIFYLSLTLPGISSIILNRQYLLSLAINLAIYSISGAIVFSIYNLISRKKVKKVK